MQEPLTQFLINKLFPPYKNRWWLQPRFQDAQMRWFLSSLPYKTLSSILNLKRFSLAKSTNPADLNSSSHCLFCNIWQETPPVATTHDLQASRGKQFNPHLHWHWNKAVPVSFLICYTKWGFIHPKEPKVKLHCKYTKKKYLLDKVNNIFQTGRWSLNLFHCHHIIF